MYLRKKKKNKQTTRKGNVTPHVVSIPCFSHYRQKKKATTTTKKNLLMELCKISTRNISNTREYFNCTTDI